MKKISILALSILFINFKANCQITKGNWLFGGNISFSSTKSSSDLGSNTTTTFQITGSGGYFFIDKLAAGIKANIYNYNYKRNENDPPGVTELSVGPFIRYYFLPIEQRVNLFAAGSYAYGSGKVAGQKAISSNEISFLAGPVVFLNNNVGIEFTIGYSFLKSNDDAHNKRNLFQTGIGLQIHLEKE